jgi:RHS repeat-associated protein
VTYPTSPSVSYVYSLSTTAASSIETIAVAPSTNLVSYALVDGLGRSVQSQSPAEGGGTDVVDTAYNSAGNVSRTNNTYWTSSVSASGTLFVPVSESAIPSEVLNQYDGADRMSSSTIDSYGTAHSVTTTAYEGSDETDSTPPAGGTPTSTFVNTLGQTKKLVQYLASTVDPSATSETTSYTYDPQGSMTSMKDPDGNQWTWSFNVLGQNTGATDPDTGTTSTTYDEAGDVLSATDARGITLAYQYDSLQRKTEEDQVNGGSTPNTELATWSYDPTGDKGQLASSTSYVGSAPGTAGAPYTETVVGYDDAYRSLGEKVSIPSSAPAFGSSTPYETDYTYNAAGTLATTKYQAAGGLPAETVKTSYDAFGNTSALSTTSTSYTITSYNPLGEVQQQYRAGSSGLATAATAYGYDPATNAVSQIETVSALGASSQIAENNNYSYDAAGNVTSIAMTSDSLGSDTQCFSYDHLQDLTKAWTPSDNDCSDAPSISGLGGAAPYWDSYTVDPATGNRTSETQHGAGGSGNDVVSDYNYPTAGSANPHEVNSIDQTVGGDASASSYSYDAAGDTTARPGETITYDPEGKVSSISDGTNTESDIYDADGNLLLQTDSTTGTTFFNGATELHLAPGSSSVSGERIYSANDVPVAERTSTAGASSNTLIWLIADDQETVNLEVNTSTGALSYRAQDPFGNSRGSSPSWSDDRGYLDAPVSTFSGLTQLGARLYDPTTGRFLSADPILDPNNPQQTNGYSYANNSPVSNEDPTGAMFEGDGGTSAPKAPGQTLIQSAVSAVSAYLFGWMKPSNQYGRQWLNTHAGVKVGADGNLRSRADAPQRALGYSLFDDWLFKTGTEAKADPVQFSYNHHAYLLDAWKGDYLPWGDGTEVGLYEQTNKFEKDTGIYGSISGSDPDLPKMSVSLSVAGTKIGSFAPKNPQNWTGIWDPAISDTDTHDIQSTITVTFRNPHMYSAFIHSPGVSNGSAPWQPGKKGTLSATLNFNN